MSPSTKIFRLSRAGWLYRFNELQGMLEWRRMLRHAKLWTIERPQDDLGWFALGIAYERTGRHGDQSASMYWFDLEPKIRSQDCPAANSAELIGAYKQAVRINPEFLGAWIRLGTAYAGTDQIANAMEAFQRSLLIDSTNVTALWGIGNCYLVTGQIRKAITAWDLMRSIETCFYRGDWNEYDGIAVESKESAAEICEHAQRSQPDNPGACCELCVAYWLCGRRDDMLKAYHRLRALEPTLADDFIARFVLPQEWRGHSGYRAYA